MSSPPFTFGVELEFCVALVLPGKIAPDHTADDKITKFPKAVDDPGSLYKTNDVHAHIKALLSSAGLPTKGLKDSSSFWQVEPDPSIQSEIRKVDNWNYTGVEVISPKLNFSRAALQEIQQVCDLVNRTYKIWLNDTCGFHVHIGHNNDGFTFRSLQKFLAFAYTFEPQINSLLAFERINHSYGGSLRDRSIFVGKFSTTHNRRPGSSDFTAKIMSCKTRAYAFLESYVDEDQTISQDGVAVCARGKGNDLTYHTKYSRYNMRGVATQPRELRRNQKPTIEFRAMEATTDGQKITNWVQVLVGILDFVENGHPSSFNEILTWAWEAEKFELMGDYREGELLPKYMGQQRRQREKILLDPERVAKFGPVFADQGFTIVDLLTWLGLDAQADYYRTRWIKHPAPLNRSRGLRSNITWDFQKTPGSEDDEDEGEVETSDRPAPGSDEYESCLQMAETFELLRIADVALKIAGEEEGLEIFLEDEEIWPKHSIYWSAELMNELAPDEPDLWKK